MLSSWHTLARELVSCTLPHTDPGEVPGWTRTKGNITLVLARTGYDAKKRRPIGRSEEHTSELLSPLSLHAALPICPASYGPWRSAALTSHKRQHHASARAFRLRRQEAETDR